MTTGKVVLIAGATVVGGSYLFNWMKVKVRGFSQ